MKGQVTESRSDPMKKDRADKILVSRGLAETPAKAQALIMAGLVTSRGQRIEKAGVPLAVDAPLQVEPTSVFVGRGGLKLAEALDVFGVSPAGLVCVDIGASTGGFTDCLLQRGAARIYAVDVDIRQLDDRLRRNPRVVQLEKNARYLRPSDFPEPVALAVMDVSFISILKILPALREVLLSDAPGSRSEAPMLLSLIKPQFEAVKGRVGRRGLVRDPAVHTEVLTRIVREARVLGFRTSGLVRLTTRGQKGNQEFFARFSLVPSSESEAAARMEPLPRDVIEWITSVIVDGLERPQGGLPE
jgi:23S rRNA (cytidine1920-2'-O)/16S rRNA (cytidine1409-2'-O)-methyltransferase